MAQQILHGIEKFKELKPEKYLLVCDSAFEYLSIKEHFDTSIKFDNFTPNPLYEQVLEGIKIFNENNCTCIVAVGGGSAIDVAKCIKLFSKMDSSTNYLLQDFKDTKIPLIAVPTTAGTGSESTKHAVIYYEGEKQSVSHDSIVPNFAILEPSALYTLPIYQKKCTMFDALCQAIESWWSVNSTDKSKEYSKTAIELITKNYKKYIFDNDTFASTKIMLASNYAGRAINITATTAPHAMSYKITSLYNIPHGHAVALNLPHVWDYMLSNVNLCGDSRGADYLNQTFADISKVITPDEFKALMVELDMKNTVISENESDIQNLVKSVNPTRLKNNPIILDNQTIKELYLKVVK